MSSYQTETTPTPLIRVHLAAANPPWRLTYAWVSIIGALYALGPTGLWKYRQEVLTVLILVDLIWGTWGWVATHTSSLRTLPPRVRWPYATDNSPWAQWNTRLPEGFFTTGISTVLLAILLCHFLGPNAAWLTAVAFGAAVGLWIWDHISPIGVTWGLPVYGWGFPLWAAGYLFGRGDFPLLGAAFTLVLTHWALRHSKWRRLFLGSAALTLWGLVTIGHMPPGLIGLTGLMWLIPLLAQGPGIGSEVLWGFALTLFALGHT